MQDHSKQLVGESPPWLTALEHASRVAPLDRSVLVIGERGTGKELIGERLHFLSKRWEGPFVKVNCAVPVVPDTSIVEPEPSPVSVMLPAPE
jgi:psp operon transcriptional activator